MASHTFEDVEVRIVNIVAKSCILKPFKLHSLTAQYPFSDPSFVLSRILIPYGNIKFSIFATGTIISRATRSVLDLEASFAWLSSLLSSFDLKLSDRYEILNVVAVAHCSPSLNLPELASHLPHCCYEPTPMLLNSHEHPLPIIVFRFNHKSARTALIFTSGNTTLTGFRSIADLQIHAGQLSALIAEIAQEHPEVISK